MRLAAEHYRKRAAAYRPNIELHALLDRIAADVRSLGTAGRRGTKAEDQTAADGDARLEEITPIELDDGVHG